MSGPDEQELRAWAYLSAVAEPPCAPLIALTERYGAVETAQMIRTRALPAGNAAVLTATQARHAADSAARDLETADRIGARLITRTDPEWPAWALLALDRAVGAARGGAPLALWVRGPGAPDALTGRAIGIVGSRAATAYGEQQAAELGSGLGGRGWTIVSGAAFGIDGAAHRGALAAGAPTVAVLACGIDRDYPSGHARLIAEIARTGLVVTEYAPGTGAAKHRFFTRNRLVAALSEALIVVEAGRRSGAANTAAWARTLGRPLGAVPGPVTSAMSVGCHQMIADGEAVLVMDAAGASALAAPDGHDNHRASPHRPIDELPPEQFRVVEALPARGALTLAEVAFVAGLPEDRVRAALARLEVSGMVELDGGSWSLAR